MQPDATRRKGFWDIPETPPGAGGVPDPEKRALLAAEAGAILEAAQRREPIDANRAERFARGCLEQSALARLVFAVLGGGPFATRRLVELATLVFKSREGLPARRAIR